MAFSYDAAIGYLYSLQSTGIKLGLDNIRLLLASLGNPEASFRCAHVAGTNGKGSTSALLASMLRASGMRTALFTSPHILSFTERISVDGARITGAEVAELAWEVREKAEGLGDSGINHPAAETAGYSDNGLGQATQSGRTTGNGPCPFSPTFFEIVTAMAFLYFKRHGARWAVIETGLGGRLDSTNTLSPAVTVIAPVGLDHKDFLGDTLKEVAYEKAGIIKERTPLVLAAQKPEALAVLLDTAKARRAPVFLEGRDFSFRLKHAGADGIIFDYSSERLSLDAVELKLRGAYQAQNGSLAIRALEAIWPEIGPGLDKESLALAAREGASNIRWHGRLERVADDVYIDGAHNPAAAEALAAELEARPIAPPERLVLVLGIMRDKDALGIIRPLLALAGEVIFTAPAYGRASRPEELALIAEGLGHKSKCFDTVAAAMKAARATGKTVLVTGSFYTMGEALEALGRKGVLTTLQEWRPAG